MMRQYLSLKLLSAVFFLLLVPHTVQGAVKQLRSSTIFQATQDDDSLDNETIQAYRKELLVKAQMQQQKELLLKQKQILLSRKTEVRLKRLSPSRRKREVRHLLPGVYVNIPEFWKSTGNPYVVFDALKQYPEPFSQDMLNALERVQPKFTGEAMKVEAAVLLYRYHRQSGRNFLIKELLESHNIQAATVLAVNQEGTQLVPIIQTFLAQPEKNILLIEALAKWHSPLVADALKLAFQNHPGNPNLILALANQGVQNAIPQIRRSYQESTIGNPTKVAAALAIIKLGGDSDHQLLNNLNIQLRSGSVSTGADMRYWIVKGFGQLSVDAIQPDVISFVTRFINEASNNNKLSMSDLLTEEDIASEAAQSLAETHNQASLATLTRLFSVMKHLNAPIFYRLRIANALLQMDNNILIVRKEFGMAWTQRHILHPALRSIPEDMLLNSENVFIRM